MPTDLMAFLKVVPGAAKAVAKLVGAPVNAVSAWIDVATAEGERRSAEIRAKSDAQVKILAAMGSVASWQIGSDQALAQRALEFFAGNLIEKQANREGVARKTLEYLADQQPINAESEVSADWLNVFSSFAEAASTEKMREHWAAILAGEIRCPGAVSLVTLNLMSFIDNDIATIIEKYSEYCLKDEAGMGILAIGPFLRTPKYDDLLKLDGIGFLSLGGHGMTSPEFRVGSRFVIRSKETDKTLEVGAAVLTKAGREIIDLLGKEQSYDNAQFILETMKAEGLDLSEIELLER